MRPQQKRLEEPRDVGEMPLSSGSRHRSPARPDLPATGARQDRANDDGSRKGELIEGIVIGRLRFRKTPLVQWERPEVMTGPWRRETRLAGMNRTPRRNGSYEANAWFRDGTPVQKVGGGRPGSSARLDPRPSSESGAPRRRARPSSSAARALRSAHLAAEPEPAAGRAGLAVHQMFGDGDQGRRGRPATGRDEACRASIGRAGVMRRAREPSPCGWRRAGRRRPFRSSTPCRFSGAFVGAPREP